MLLKFKKSATEWISLYADAIKNRLRRDLNLSDATDKAACRKNIELVGEVSDHYHDNRYLPLIEANKDDVKNIVKNLMIAISGDVNGTAAGPDVNNLITVQASNVTASKSKLTTSSSSVSMNIPFAGGTGVQELLINNNLKFVPSTGALSASILTSNSIKTGIVNADTVYNAVWNDYAEFFPRGEETESGDIIMLNMTSNQEKYVKAIAGTNTCIVGVHSNEFAMLIGGETPPEDADYFSHNIEKYIPVGLVGRVHVKFIGASQKGGKVVPSETAGCGRLYDPARDAIDAIIGYLVESDSKIDERKLRMKLR
jgi:hypothetical protein